MFLFEAVNTCFLVTSRIFSAVLLNIYIFEKSKLAAKTVDMLSNDCCHSNNS